VTQLNVEWIRLWEQDILNEIDLLSDCLQHHSKVEHLDFVVPKAVPIPFFGDLDMYLGSDIRILTAALNPSKMEFPSNGPARFDVVRGRRDPNALKEELCRYFERAPYRSWFLNFEKLLSGMDASYGGRMRSDDIPARRTALHIDICSPIATAPTWSRLSRDHRNTLTVFGHEMFDRLLEFLRPNVVVASVGWAHLEAWSSQFVGGRNWPCCYLEHLTAAGSPMRSPVRVQSGHIVGTDSAKYLFFNATAANTPLGRFTDERKRIAGRRILNSM
jgi:hypothetical protein